MSSTRIAINHITSFKSALLLKRYFQIELLVVSQGLEPSKVFVIKLHLLIPLGLGSYLSS